MNKGFLFALAAATLNATNSIMSKYLILAGLGSSSIAFYKSAVGTVLLFLLLRPKKLNVSLLGTALCAFTGVFCLYFFETTALKNDSAANVVVTLMAVAGLSSIFLGWIVLGDKPTKYQWLSLLLSSIGISLILGISGHATGLGMFCAAIAGLGYGAFSVIAKKINLGSGLHATRQLLWMGTAFLAIPYGLDGFPIPVLTPMVILSLLGLALLPSIGGFYCTTQALHYSKPSQVQLVELSEPLLATILAFIILNEQPGLGTYLGGTLVLIGVLLTQLDQKEAPPVINYQ